MKHLKSLSKLLVGYPLNCSFTLAPYSLLRLSDAFVYLTGSAMVMEHSLYMVVAGGPCDEAADGGGGGIECHGTRCIGTMEAPFGGLYDGALGDGIGFRRTE